MKIKTYNHALLTGILAIGISSTIQAGLILHYTFDEGSGTSAASSVNGTAGNTLTLSATGSGWGAGQSGFGGAMQITSGAGSALAADAGTWSPHVYGSGANQSITMTMWVNLTAGQSSAPTLMGAADTGNFRHQGVIRANGGASPMEAGGFIRTAGSAQTIQTTRNATSGFAAGEWHHLAMTLDVTDAVTDTATMRFYIDGVQKSTVIDSAWAGWDLASGLNESGVGAGNNGTHSFSGLYDDVRIYDTALTPAEVLESMHAIPEPSSTALLGLGSLALILRRRK